MNKALPGILSCTCSASFLLSPCPHSSLLLCFCFLGQITWLPAQLGWLYHPARRWRSFRFIQFFSHPGVERCGNKEGEYTCNKAGNINDQKQSSFKYRDKDLNKYEGKEKISLSWSQWKALSHLYRNTHLTCALWQASLPALILHISE